ncbi:diguanylate cyclase domain-containing protein [Zavarzinia sp. CC-PAN008]|uniref:diguanylate cyclase domain-containing protein n=1 Tax=Zavarzinia sp. CC-PAN008 TaxID=3243332 RepID=UPI003F744E17
MASAGPSPPLLDLMPDGLAVLDARGRILTATARSRALLGHSLDPGLPFDRVMSECVAAGTLRLEPDVLGRVLADLKADEQATARPAFVPLADGRWLRLIASPSPEGGQVMLLGDVTALKARERLHRQTRRLFALTIRAATDGFFHWDTATDTTYYSPRLNEMLGLAPGTLNDAGPTLRSLIHPDDVPGQGRAFQQMLDGADRVEVQGRLAHADGGWRWAAFRVLPVRDDDGQIVQMIGAISDITARREAEDALLRANHELEARVVARTAELQAANDALRREVDERRRIQARLEHLARHDALTGLPNRRALEEHLEQMKAQRSATGAPTLAVCYLDLDGFKAANDTHGHDFGDFLLVTVAERLQACAGAGNLVARLGGDEFVAVLDLARGVDHEAFLAAALARVAEPVSDAQGRGAVVTLSAGVALWPDAANDGTGLIRAADTAMYAAKRSGKATWRLARGPEVAVPPTQDRRRRPESD